MDAAAEKRDRKADRRRHEEKPGADGKAKGGLPPMGEGENRLLRDTPFLCEFQFRNELPLPPVGPKLLPLAVDRARLSAYQPFGFLWDRPQDCPFERDLGISVDPLEAERFRAPPGGAPPLDPEDEALFAAAGVPGGAAGEAAGGGVFRSRRGPGGDTKSGWLMRTIYLSAQELPTFKAKDEDENARGRSVKERRLAEEGVLLRIPEGSDARSAQVAAIEAQFEAVRGTPVHATNPALTPVEVLPVLPDLERCHNAFVQVAFDCDPMLELLPPASTASSTAAAQREALARRAFLKTYVVGRDETGQLPEKLIVYFAPTAGVSAPPPADGTPVDFQWVREYNYKIVAENEGAQPLLVFNLPATLLHGRTPATPAAAAASASQETAAPAAEYVFVERKLDLRRRITRSASQGDGGDAPLPRPATVSLTNRKRSVEEEEVVVAAKRALTHPERERPLTPMEEEEAPQLALQDAETVAAAAVTDVFGDEDE